MRISIWVLIGSIGKALVDSVHDSLWRGNTPLVLASTSKTRVNLLASTGLFAESVAPEVDERVIEAATIGLTPIKLACRLAEAKASNVARRRPGQIVIGADQILQLDGSVIHKPRDIMEARDHLMRLQGRSHSLISAVAIVRNGTVDVFHETAWLTMRPLDPAGIAMYISLAGEICVTSSVGAYQLESLGIHLFSHINGDQSTILGLPLLPLLSRLRKMGLIAL